MKKADPLPALLRAFFYEWLVEQRNASFRSYRDAWRLFLRFVAQRHHRTVAQLRLGDLTGSEVGLPPIHRAGARRFHRHT
jgi:hypothetical protein